MHKGVNTTMDEGQTMVAHALRGEGFDASEDGTGRGTPLAPIAFHNRQDPDISGAVTHPLGAKDNGMAVAFQDRFRGDDGRGYDRAPPVSRDVVGSLETVKPWNVATPWAVRRLTPRECSRLMGFPDDWARIPYRGKPADQCPDGPQYKAYGNSWAVNCGEFVFDRLRMVEETWPVEIAEAAE